jgi:hypothetical protein
MTNDFDPTQESDVQDAPVSGETQAARPSIAARIVSGVDAGHYALSIWRTPQERIFASLSGAQRADHQPLDGPRVRAHLASHYDRQHHSVPADNTIRSAVSVLNVRAAASAPVHPTYVRVAGELDEAGNVRCVLLDLADAEGRAVEVTADGWRVLTNAEVVPRVKFMRTSRLAPLPVPMRGGSLATLRQYLNVSEADWPLVVAWLLNALRHIGPYTVLLLIGAEGTAKTTTAQLLRELIDPSTLSPADQLAETTLIGKEPEDIYLAATRCWVQSYGNVSHLPQSLSDVFASLSTGGGTERRTKYTDLDETIFQASRPVILGGIDDFVHSRDLLDRAALLQPPKLSSKRPPAELLRAYAVDRPAMLGALLDLLSVALRVAPTVEPPEGVRMVDAARMALALEKAGVAPWETGAFMAAARRVNREATRVVLDVNPFTRALREYVDARGAIDMELGQLLEAINATASEDVKRLREWPKNGRKIRALLNRVSTSLEQSGYTVAYHQSSRDLSAVAIVAPKPPERSLEEQAADAEREAKVAAERARELRAKAAQAAAEKMAKKDAGL